MPGDQAAIANVPTYVPSQWRQYVANAAAKWGVPANVIAAVIQTESSWDINSGDNVDSYNSYGLGQLIQMNWASYPRYKPGDADGQIDTVGQILSGNYKATKNWPAAIAAYNTGLGGIVNGQPTGNGPHYVDVVQKWMGGQTAALVGNATAAVKRVLSAVFPLGPGYITTQGFSGAGGHDGVDLAAPAGTPIFAVKAGKIVSVGGDPNGFGNDYPVEQLPDGTQVTYGHASKSYVRAGDSVTAGQHIADVGSEGDSTGPHLHLRIHDGTGKAVDPLEWLKGADAVDATAILASAGSAADQLGTASGSLDDTDALGIVGTVFFLGLKVMLTGFGATLVVLGLASTTRRPK